MTKKKCKTTRKRHKTDTKKATTKKSDNKGREQITKRCKT